MTGWTAIIRNRDDYERVIDRLDQGLMSGPQKVTLTRYRKKRSIAQNSLMWMWYDVISKHVFESMGAMYSSEDINEYFKQLFLPKRVIEFKHKALDIQIGTSELTTMEMMEYLDKLDYYCVEKLDLILPKPEDLWEQAYGEEN